MRSILVGAVVVMAAVAGPAFAGGIVDDSERRPGPAQGASSTLEVEPVVRERTVINQTPPFGDVVVEDYHSAGAEFGMGVASTILSIFYTPVRFTVGVVGAGLGGVEGFLTGGDLRTARSMWRPTVEGDYFIRPDHLDRTEHYEFSNVRSVARERYTIRGRQPVVVEERVTTATVTRAPRDTGIDPIEPELEDGMDDR